VGDFEVVSAKKEGATAGEVVVRKKQTGIQVIIRLKVEPEAPHRIVTMRIGKG